MNKRGWLSYLGVLCLLALALALPQPAPAAVAAPWGIFVEDFATTHYKDTTSETTWNIASRQLYLVSRPSEQDRPVLVLGDDSLFAAWWDTRGPNRRVYYQWIDAGGSLGAGHGYLTARDLPQEGSTLATQYGGPAAAIDPSSNAVVAWPARVDGLYTIFVQRIGPNGEKLWSEHRPVLPAGSSVPLHHPSLDVGPSGGIVVTWTAGDAYHVYAQRFSPDGTRLWGSGVQVDSTTQVPDDSAYQDTRARVSFVGMTNADEAYIVMNSDAEPNALSQYEYFAAGQKLNTAGGRVWPHDKIVLATHDPFFGLEAAGYPGGGMAAVYQMELSGYLGSQIIHSDGTSEPAPGFAYVCFPPCPRLSVAPESGGGLWYAWQGSDGVYGNWYDFETVRPPFLIEAGGSSPSIVGNFAQSFTAYIKAGEDDRSRLWVEAVDGMGYPTMGLPMRVVPYDSYTAETGTAASKKVNDTFGAVGSASLSPEMVLNGGAAAFELSNDGGAHWYAAAPGATVNFPTAASDLRWRVTLSSPHDGQSSPLVTRVTILYSAPNTPTPTLTRTPTATRTVTPTRTATATATPTPTATRLSEEDMPLKLFLPWVKR